MRKKRRRLPSPESQNASTPTEEQQDGLKRECPVPKPQGFIGQLLGFKNEGQRTGVEVVVKPLSSRRGKQEGDERT